MKNIIVLLFVSFLSLNSFSQEKKNKNKKVEFPVAGNCEMCQKRIEKAALSVKGVKIANWNLDQKNIHLVIDENKCSAEDVKKAIAKAGHDAGKVKALDKDYDDLHGCCQYERF